MRTRSIVGGATAAALALLASGCADQLTSPAARAGVASYVTSPSGVTLIPNTVRYRDTGGKPATGRAGAAAVDALVLLGRDETTEVRLRARAAAASNPAAGTVRRVQLKVYSRDDSLRATRSVAGGEPLVLPALPRGTRVDVQANVTGIDPHRTDVVSVSSTVRMRPDLRVEGGLATDSVRVGTPLVVGSLVSELNGDLGAEADCVLRVDGPVADEARRIWVDAGDRVSCVFTIPSLAEGTHTLSVSADAVTPGDWDVSNNAVTMTVTAYSEPVNVDVGGQVRVENFSSREFWRTTEYNWGYGTDHWDERRSSGTMQTVSILGTIDRGFAAPVTVRMRESSGGAVFNEDEFTVPDYDAPYICASRTNPAQGTSFYFCSLYGMRTDVTFERRSGTVMYHSLGYYREWDDNAGEELFYWHWDNTDTRDNAVPIGSDYGFTLEFATPSGETVTVPFVAQLDPFEEDYLEPDWCYEDGGVEWGYFYRSCYGSSYRATGVSGWLSPVP